MGFARSPAPHVIEAAMAAPVELLITIEDVSGVTRALDPFGIADRCEFSPAGDHYGIGSCGDVVCCYCSRIFWR